VSIRLIVVPVAFCLSTAAVAAGISADHPILGTWTYAVPGTSCAETYRFRPDGTTFVTSGQEVSESAYTIAPKPSPRGFYKWSDTVTKDNGKPDCGGAVTTVGNQATNFVRLHPSGELMVVCREESLDACFGPLKRVHGQES